METTMDYVIIVNDNGELKTISATELSGYNEGIAHALEGQINGVLDMKSAREAMADFRRRHPEPKQVFDAAEHARRERSLYDESDGIPGDAI
jgi:hypothetical protein